MAEPGKLRIIVLYLGILTSVIQNSESKCSITTTTCDKIQFWPFKKEYKVNDVVESVCVEGYKLNGFRLSQCYSYGWDPPLPECEEDSSGSPGSGVREGIQRGSECPQPPTIRHAGKFDIKENYVNGDTLRIKCLPGRSIQGMSYIRCENGAWTSPPTCTLARNLCRHPPTVPHAETVERPFWIKIDNVVEYKCEDNYVLEGRRRIRCQDGVWDDPPVCHAPCPIKKEDMKTNNIELQWSFSSEVIKHDEDIGFKCLPGYQSDGNLLQVKCNNGVLNYPKCIQRDKAKGCGPPPSIQFGDIIQAVLPKYNSGVELEYKCPNYFKLEGNAKVKCWDGVWSDPPVCLEPCTVSAKDMQANNIELQWVSASKLYASHGSAIEFKCLSRYEIAEGKSLRVQCNKGVLMYPTCTKPGSCLLSQTEMQNNNVFINDRTEVDNGELVTFECKEGNVPENTLLSTCRERKLIYPKCVKNEQKDEGEDQFDDPLSSPDKIPGIPKGKCVAPPDVPNGKLTTKQQESYDADSSVEFKCDLGFVLSGSASIKCEDGQWSNPPRCARTCRISIEDLDKYNVALLSPDDLTSVHSDGSQVNIRCKPKTRRPFHISLTAECNDGKMRYERCFSKSICRLNQDAIDENHLELDPKHDDELYYEDEEEVAFRCKEGFYGKSLTGRCSGTVLTYPVCKEL